MQASKLFRDKSLDTDIHLIVSNLILFEDMKVRRLVWGFVCFVFCYCCFYYLNTFIYVIALPVFFVVMQFCFGLGTF